MNILRCMVLVGIASALPAAAQRPPDIALTPEINRDVVRNAIRAVDKYYFSEDVAARVHAGLAAKLEQGAYDGITSAFDLVDALDEHLHALSGDAHLKTAYSHRSAPPVQEVGENIRPETPEERAESYDEARHSNFGIQKTARLAGNVGLLELNRFVRPEFGGESFGKAMALLAASDALILDLRNTRGGSPDMVQFIASYFFPGDEAYYLGDWFTRVEGGTQQLWTYPYLPGQRYLDKPVYVLTARTTFSAPEGLAAFLQHHGKAVVVGEKTIGGTHPVVMVRVHSNFAIAVPVSMPVYPAGSPTSPLNRPIYPERTADAAGTPVVPDIEAPANRALRSAHVAALTRLIETDPERAGELQPVIDQLQTE